MSRQLKITLGIVAATVLIGAIYFPGLHRRLLELAHMQRSQEEERREAVRPPVATPTDVMVKAAFFWISTVTPDTLEPVEVRLPLSADRVQRARQLLDALITKAPSPEQRTLPLDASLLEFYLMPGGIAVADFSDSLATATPSGILSEVMAVESIKRTLEANLPELRQLKILIHGQETETLAGHVDLAGYFTLQATATSPQTTGSAPPLTAPAAPGKLKH